MSINIIPPDPKAAEKLFKKRVEVAAVAGCFVMAATFLYFVGAGLGCYNFTNGTHYPGCLSTFHPYWAAIVGSATLFVGCIFIGAQMSD